jgi:hypothetical protein
MIQHMKEHGLVDPGSTAKDPAVLEEGVVLEPSLGHRLVELPNRETYAAR